MFVEPGQAHYSQGMIRIGVVALACLCSVGACQNQNSQTRQGLPPAESWQEPTPTVPAAAADPHAGMGMNDPHAGLDMNDPHAGLDMGDPHAGLDMNDPHAGLDMGGGTADVAAMGLPSPDPDRAIDPDKYLKGTIKPTAETKSKIPPGSVIFMSVKRADPQTGQPTGSSLAVKRLQVSSWPMWFELTNADAMVGGTEFAGDVVITAWSDSDQDAISKSPGDVLGEVRATIPAKELTLVLDTVLP
ncbi:hypothetical protein [Haliangium sp.]|uniref:hypothetical protein n=1 Tax=Haliangium sp. TaxID=2663208 RepID=UPI003D13F55D